LNESSSSEYDSESESSDEVEKMYLLEKDITNKIIHSASLLTDEVPYEVMKLVSNNKISKEHAELVRERNEHEIPDDDELEVAR
jgi:hypothetical protein